jgi:lysophospholipase L1-like esterase
MGVCASRAGQPGTVRAPGKIVACVGDSITAGQSEKTSYPRQLQVILGEGYEVLNFGVGGTCLVEDGDLPYSEQETYQSALHCIPDILIVMLGTNDLKTQNWDRVLHHGGFGACSSKFIQTFTNYAKAARMRSSSSTTHQQIPMPGTIVVCRPPPMVGDRWAEEIKKQEILLRELDEMCEWNEWLVPCDCHSLFVQSPTASELLQKDGLHPTEQGALLIAQTIAREIMNGRNRR